MVLAVVFGLFVFVGAIALLRAHAGNLRSAPAAAAQAIRGPVEVPAPARAALRTQQPSKAPQ